MLHRIGLLRAAVLVLVAALGGGSLSAAAATLEPAAVRLLVHTRGAPPSARALATASALQVLAVRPLAGDLAVVTLRAPDGADAAARTLASLPQVLDASVDHRIGLAGAASPVRPGNSLYAHQWDLWDSSSDARAGGYGVDAPRAWTRTLGSPDVVVAVLDTGMTAHPDLAGASVASGYDFVSGADGVDPGDGDGWDQDPTDPGDACAETKERSSWHGTFVAGELVARHGNGGIAGMAPGVTIEPVRVLGGCGGSEADTVAAIEWASGGTVPGVPVNPRPAAVLSMSLGAIVGTCPPALQAAVDDAIARGSVLVAAAGNEGRSIAGTSPADCTGVISVVASTRSGSLASYSNRGTTALTPTIAAPGGSERDPVLGDGWTSAGSASDAANRPTVIASAGTSMAAPRVAAAAALLLSRDRALTPAAVAARLVTSATRFPAGSTCTAARCGAGLLNAGDLLRADRRFVLASRVRITGRPVPGHRLTAAGGRWRPVPAHLEYRWLRDGRPIPGATAEHYRIRAADAGHRLAVRVTAVRGRTVAARSVSHARPIGRR